MNHQDAKNISTEQKLLLAITKGDKADQCTHWQAFATQQGLSNEWVMNARLDTPAFTEEQAHMVACLFGRC